MKIFLLICSLLVVQACKMDTQVQHELTGTWKVKASLPKKTDKETQAPPPPDGQNDTELRTNEGVPSASENENEWDDLAKGFDQLVKGFEQLADGLAEIGTGIGKGIEEAITQNLSATVTLQADSTLQFLPDNADLDLELGQEKIRWWVDDGNFLIRKSEKDSVLKLSIVPVAGGYDLQHEKIHLHLRKPE